MIRVLIAAALGLMVETTGRAMSRPRAAAAGEAPDRGDVPGWVLVTLMTAGLVLTLWAVAGPRFVEVFESSIDSVVGGP